jgi:signal peptidase I
VGSRGRNRPEYGQDVRLPTGSRPTAPGAGEAGAVGRTGPGRAERRKLARRVKRRRRRSAIKEIPVLIGVALLIALVLKTFLVQAFVIPSGSMEQTIRIGDRVLVDKLTPWFGSRPERGEVVVFRDPGGWLEKEAAPEKPDPVVIKQVKEGLTWIGLLPSADEQDLIKRVVAVGGDTVKCCDRNGQVTVNGVPLSEPYVFPNDRPSKIPFEVRVPEGRIFVMGDHRSNSADSRYHLNEKYQGTVAEEGVLGRAVVIAWPVGHWRKLEVPETFARIPEPRAGSAAAPERSNRVAFQDRQVLLPSPGELPLVMGVMGLRLLGRGRWHGVRSGRGGCGGRGPVRTRRTREEARARAARRRAPAHEPGPGDGAAAER